MKVDLFSIGNFVVHGYGFMIGIGFVLALLLGEFRAKKLKLKDDVVLDIAIIAGVGGFFGAKFLYVIVSFHDFLHDPLGVLGSSGFVVYGGLIFGVLFNYIYIKIKKLNFLEYFDLIMPEIALAQAFGRIGCFLAGCCYGRHTDAFFGVVFPEGCLAPPGIKLIPTQLISSAADFANMAILLFIATKFSYSAAKKKLAEGQKNVKALRAGDIGALFFIFYGIGRFAIEFLRNDYRGAVGFLSTSQFISLIIVVMGVCLMVATRKLPFKNVDANVGDSNEE